MSSPSPDELDKYWPVIYRLVLQGELRQAIDLLQKNSQFHHHSKVSHKFIRTVDTKSNDITGNYKFFFLFEVEWYNLTYLTPSYLTALTFLFVCFCFVGLLLFVVVCLFVLCVFCFSYPHIIDFV